MTALIKYDEACRALADAVAIDEIMEIRDLAEMHAAAARIAGNRKLEMQAVELRMRGTRRLGEIIARQKEAVGLHKGGRPVKTETATEASAPIKLADVGVSKKLSSQAQQLAAVSADEFEGLIETWRFDCETRDGRLVTDLTRIGAEQRQREARRELARELSDHALEMTGTRQYPCIYLDPPWQRKQGITDRSYENHYPTMTWGEIIAWASRMRVRLLADAWGFMWIPRAHLFAPHPVIYEIEPGRRTEAIPTPLPWAIALALGFDNYSTCFIWTKTDEEHAEECGLGLLVRDQDEMLLMFKRGRGLPKPSASEKVGSNHRERSRPLGHSRKPQHYREIIARMVGRGVPVLECFARHDEKFPLPEGWDSWGNQAAAPQAAE